MAELEFSKGKILTAPMSSKLVIDTYGNISFVAAKRLPWYRRLFDWVFKKG